MTEAATGPLAGQVAATPALGRSDAGAGEDPRATTARAKFATRSIARRAPQSWDALSLPMRREAPPVRMIASKRGSRVHCGARISQTLFVPIQMGRSI
jgi:hypothetical protein